MQRTLCIHHAYPVLIIAALETRVREDLTSLPEESGSWERRAEDHLLPHCGHFRSLRKVIIAISGPYRVYELLGATANGSGHDLIWDWPEFGLLVRGARPDAHWRPIEAPSVVTRNEEAAALDAAKSQLESPTAGEADPRHAETIIRDAGAENVKTISTPATKETGRELEEQRRQDFNGRRLSGKLGSKTDNVDKEDALSEDEVTRYRRIAAWANFLAQDRMDIAYAAKEATRRMTAPTTDDWNNLVRLGRYLARYPRVVNWY